MCERTKRKEYNGKLEKKIKALGERESKKMGRKRKGLTGSWGEREGILGEGIKRLFGRWEDEGRREGKRE